MHKHSRPDTMACELCRQRNIATNRHVATTHATGSRRKQSSHSLHTPSTHCAGSCSGRSLTISAADNSKQQHSTVDSTSSSCTQDQNLNQSQTQPPSASALSLHRLVSWWLITAWNIQAYLSLSDGRAGRASSSRVWVRGGCFSCSSCARRVPS